MTERKTYHIFWTLNKLVEEINMKWTIEAVENYYALPLMDLLFAAQTVHRANFNPNEIECCTLLSIKTGACPEDCAYCPQSAHYNTNLKKEKLLDIEAVKAKAILAKQNGATRFCMGAAWRNPPKKEFAKVLQMIQEVKALGLETCVTLGMLDQEQAEALKNAGLDFYNHNLDTSKNYYSEIISTRTYEDRLDTLAQVRAAGINVCCGGIMGMGESREDRIAFLLELANLPQQPESVPINKLVRVPGTPLEKGLDITHIEFIRTIAIARILMPKAMLRLSAGRSTMSLEMQILCFFAGANSIWLGDKLLVTPNNNENQDKLMFANLGLNVKTRAEHSMAT